MNRGESLTVRHSINRYWGWTAIGAGLAIVAVAYLRYGEVRKQLPVDEKQEEMYLRVSLGEKKWSYQSFEVARPNREGRAVFKVDLPRDSSLELGVLFSDSEYRPHRRKHRRKKWPVPRYKLKLYSKSWFGEKVLLETVESFPINELFSVRYTADQLGWFGRSTEIVYELAVVESEVSRELIEDMAFLVPKVARKRKPDELNVVLISFDTLRADHLGSYGYSRETSPNLDRFAAGSFRFSQAITTAPWTTPSHYSLFTSLYPSAHQNSRLAAADLRSDWTLARLLQREGYYTFGSSGGGSISSSFGMGNGFGTYREYNSYPNTTKPSVAWEHEDDTARSFEDAFRFVEMHATDKFFLFLQHFECHDPYESPHFLQDMGTQELIEQRRALYDGDIRKADEFFGRLVQKLEALGLMDKTMIVFVSDHGEEFYEHYTETDVVPRRPDPLVAEISYVDHAHSLYEELLRIPLIFYVPGLGPAGKVIDNQVSLVDVMPTILDILDIEYSGPIQGTSLVELMKEGERRRDPPVLSEAVAFGPERKALRMDGFKYIWIPDFDQAPKRGTFRNLEEFQFFDLENDPAETTNLYVEYRDKAAVYHEMLIANLKESRRIANLLNDRRGTEEVELEDDVLEALEALGYLE